MIPFLSMVDSNLHRERISYSEKAFCLQNETRGHETPRFSDRLDFGTKCPKVQKEQRKQLRMGQVKAINRFSVTLD